MTRSMDEFYLFLPVFEVAYLNKTLQTAITSQTKWEIPDLYYVNEPISALSDSTSISVFCAVILHLLIVAGLIES